MTNIFDGLPTIDINHGQYTKKRLVVTIRKPNTITGNAAGNVVLEAEDGSGVVVAMFGPDTPAARADAARMMALWNDKLRHGQDIIGTKDG